MHYGKIFLQKYLTAVKVSSSVLIAILNMHFFVRTKLLEWNVTGLAYSDKLVTLTPSNSSSLRLETTFSPIYSRIFCS